MESNKIIHDISLTNIVDLLKRTTAFSNEQIIDLFKVLSGILYLGQIELTEESIALVKGYIMLDNYGEEWSSAASLLGLRTGDLVGLLTRRKIQTNESNFIDIELNPSQSRTKRSAIATELYNKVFSYIVKKSDHLATQKGDMTSQCKFISMLDIFGFESLEVNGLEQLLINYTNEKLQELFVMQTIVLQQNEYELEGIENCPCMFSFNVLSETLEAIEGKHGIFSCIDELSKRSKSQIKVPSELNLLNSLSSSEHLSMSTSFKLTKRYNKTFSVSHYAGVIEYDASRMIEKNNDFDWSIIKPIVVKSTNLLLRAILEDELNVPSTEGICEASQENQSDNKRIGRFLSSESVSSKFKRNLSQLIQTISDTDVLFLKCIKPNNDKLPQTFDENVVESQLINSGISEVARISRRRFTYKLPLPRFLREYGCLLSFSKWRETIVSHNISTLGHGELKCAALICMQKVYNQPSDKSSNFAVGNTSIYFSKEVLNKLMDAKLKILNAQANIIKISIQQYIFKKHEQMVLSLMSIVSRFRLNYDHFQAVQIIQSNLKTQKQSAGMVVLRALKQKMLISRNSKQFEVAEIPQKTAKSARRNKKCLKTVTIANKMKLLHKIAYKINFINSRSVNVQHYPSKYDNSVKSEPYMGQVQSKYFKHHLKLRNKLSANNPNQSQLIKYKPICPNFVQCRSCKEPEATESTEAWDFLFCAILLYVVAAFTH